MDPCKIIALSWNYIRCSVSTATAISRDSQAGSECNSVPIATKVRSATRADTHVCIHPGSFLCTHTAASRAGEGN